MATGLLRGIEGRVGRHGHLRCGCCGLASAGAAWRAIEGKGAYRRFRDLIHDEGLTQAWQDFSDERQIGRARQYLAEQGIPATS